MPYTHHRLFELDVWEPALEKYASVTRLTVALYDLNGRLIVGPVNPLPLFGLFAEHRTSNLFTEGVHRCLIASDRRVSIIVANTEPFGIVCAPLTLNGRVVAAATAGYGLLEFPHADALERFAREVHISSERAWEIVRRATPISRSQYIVQGELLQVFGDTILRETYRTLQYEEAAAELKATAAAKDEFLAVLSHELRTPLTPILGWARMLRRDSDGEHVERAARSIERNALLQLRLVDDLLELTRVARGKVTLDLKIHDLGDAIRMALEAIQEPAQQKDVTLQLLEADEPLLVEADADRTQQIFRNVFSNALKFTPAGGTISVAAAREGSHAVIRIGDTGEGIAPEFLPFVFDMFRQQEEGTRRTHHGLGIGLALVKRLTELQRGTVTVASDGIGAGTDVTFRFPLSVDLLATRGMAAAPREILRRLNGLRILVVEDVDDSREAIRTMLEHFGAEVCVAVDGYDALTAVERHNPDIVLCDLRMPRMDGFEFIRQVHAVADHADLPVIAISGLTSTTDRQRTRAAGFDGHIDKPFDDVTLVTAVGTAIARRRE